MSGEADTGRDAIREQVQRALRAGKRCSSCFVEVLRGQGLPVPAQVSDLAPFLERGVGGSGYACGVFLAAVLTRAINAEGDRSRPTRHHPAPYNEWLDAFTPHALELPSSSDAAALARRLSSYAQERFGGADCHTISGAEWARMSIGLDATYRSGGGAGRCAEFITEAVQAVKDSLAATASPRA